MSFKEFLTERKDMGEFAGKDLKKLSTTELKSLTLDILNTFPVPELKKLTVMKRADKNAPLGQLLKVKGDEVHVLWSFSKSKSWIKFNEITFI